MSGLLRIQVATLVEQAASLLCRNAMQRAAWPALTKTGSGMKLKDGCQHHFAPFSLVRTWV